MRERHTSRTRLEGVSNDPRAFRTPKAGREYELQTLSHASPLVPWSFEGIARLLSACGGNPGATAQRHCGGAWAFNVGFFSLQIQEPEFRIDGQSVGDDRRSGDAM
jgi:hypothetical protein